MKKLLPAILILLSITAFAQQKTKVTQKPKAQAQLKPVTLSGKLINFSNQVDVEDMSEFQYLNVASSDRLIIPDSAGKFSITFKIPAPNYFRVGRNILYLTPGDKMEVVIDKNAPTKGAFKGIGATANTYLNNTPFPKGGSFLEAGAKIKPTPQETLDGIMATATERLKQLNELTGVSPEFKRLEKARVKADVLCSFNAMGIYAKMNKKLTAPEDYIKLFYSEANVTKNEYEKGFTDASLMKLVVYRDVAEDMVKNATATAGADVNQIKDWYKTSDLVDRMSHEGDKTKLIAYRQSVDSIQTKSYREAAKKHLESLLQFGKGDIAVDFTAVDLNGKKVALSSLKGKIIYVDMWATWCGPCLAEMPKLEEVKAKYKDNPNVVFLSLSIDDDNQLDKWKQNVASRKADGYQWQINRTKLDKYNVTTIPRTLLIDKDFKVASMSAPLPSAKDLSATINKLLN